MSAGRREEEENHHPHQPDVRQGHHRQDAADRQNFERQITKQFDGVVLKDRHITGDAVHELAGSVPLEEGQGLAMDVGVETASQVVRSLVEHAGFHLQEGRMRI